MNDENWRHFKGNPRGTAFSCQDGSSTFPEEKWRVQVGSHLYSSPVIAQGCLYVLSLKQPEAYFCAISIKTGETLWKHSVIFSPPCVWYSVASEENKIYIPDYDCFRVLDASSGEILCEREFKKGNTSSPSLISGENFYVCTDGGLLALNSENLGLRWEFKTSSPVEGRPIVNDEYIYIASSYPSGSLHCIDAISGKEIWEFVVDGGFISSTPAYYDNRIVFSSRKGKHSQSIYVVDASTGKLIWSKELVNVAGLQVARSNKKDSFTSYSLSSSPAVDLNSIYIGSIDGAIYAVDKVNGDVKWCLQTSDIISCSPSVTLSTVYCGSNSGTMYSIDTLSGNVNWEYKASNGLFSSPALAGDSVYFASIDGWLYRLKL